MPVSYAKVASMRTTPNVVVSRAQKKDTEYKVLVKPKDMETCKNSDEVKVLLQRELDTEKDNLKIRKLIKLKEKAVILEVDGKVDLDIIRDKLNRSEKLKTTVLGS